MKATFLLILFCLFFNTINAQDYKKIIEKANEFYNSKDYNKSVELYEEAFKIKMDEYVDIYNAACSSSLANMPSKAFKYLNLSVDTGWDNIEHLKKDTDLESLHSTKSWDELLSKLQFKLDLKNLVPYRIKNKWGYSNINGKVIIPPKFDSVSFFRPDYFLHKYLAINRINGKYCLMANDSQMIIPPKYEKLQLIDNGLLIAKKGNKYGVIDSKNTILLPMNYDSIVENFEYINSSKSYYYLSKMGKEYFIIDSKFKVKRINQEEYDLKNDEHVKGYHFDKIALEKEKWAYISKNKLQIIENNKVLIDSFSIKPFELWGSYSDLVKIYKNGKSGFMKIDELMKEKIEIFILPKYDTIIDISFESETMKPRFFLAKNNNKITVVDFDNNVLLEPLYEDYKRFGYYDIYTKEKGKYGYFRFKNKIEIKPKYDYLEMSYDNDNLLKVKLNKEWGYVNINGFEYFEN